ncbi:MAG: hypothetical protein NE330_18985 [Lentisphaeraceae bacterium]|nr:hypothetical protein [Lentisphaeraceae bacterium]
MDNLVKNLFASEETVSVNDYEVLMNSGFPAWAIVLCAIALGFYAWLMYKKESPATTGKQLVILTVLRFATCFLLMLLLLQPKIKLDTQESSRTVLPVLIDVSQSMGIVEKKASDSYLKEMAEAGGVRQQDAAQSSRLELVSNILNNKELGVIDELKEKYAVKFYLFDQKTRQLQTDTDLITLPTAEGEATGLGPAISYVEESLKGLPVANMIIFSDGIHNKGESPLEVARALKEKGTRLFPVGIGMPENIDLKVRNVNVSELLFKGDDVAVNVVFEGSGIEETELEAVLYMGDKVVGRKVVTCQNGIFKQIFIVRPETKGDFEFRVALEKHQDEYFTGNNEVSRQVSVIDSEIRVLLAVGNPSWEYRYLKGMLDSDKRFKTKVFIRSGDMSRSNSDEQFLSSFPFEKLNEIDCIILNNIDRDYFSTERMKQLQDYVSNKGGSLIMISAPSGTPGSFTGTPIEEMLPVTIRKVTEPEEEDFSKKNTRAYPLRLTEDGRESIITRLTPHPEENAKLWEKLPGQYWYYKGIRKLKPGAVALVEHGKVTNEYGAIPLMAYQRFGRGQVLFLGFNSIWRWRFRIGSKFTDRFWGQTMQNLGLPHLMGNMHNVSIETVGRDFAAGEKIDVTCRVINESLSNSIGDDITLIASEFEGENVKEFKIARSAMSNEFLGSIVLPEGSWDLQVQGQENEARQRIRIQKSNLEFEKTSMDKVQLSRIAEISGGQFISVSQIADLPQLVSEKVRLNRVVYEKSLWDSWIFLILICVFTASEWLLRKKENLP